MRVLLGGIIGAAAAAAAWMAIEHSTRLEFGWMAVFVGLVTGFVVHKAAGAASPSSYGRGAMAAVFALIACVGCRQVYAKVMGQFDLGAAVAVAAGPAEAGEAEAEDAKPGQAADETSKLDLLLGDQHAPRADGFGGEALVKGASPWDMLWLSIAAFTAYGVGKGRDQVQASEEEAESSEPVEDEPA